MSVRAVTPWVTEIRGHIQIHPADCTNDCCGVDLVQDHVWEDADPSGFYPDERIAEFHRS